MTEAPFRETTSSVSEGMYLLECPKCGYVHERRRDSFLPGAHVIICKNFEGSCGYSTTAVVLLTGERREVTAEAHRGGGV